MTFRAFLIAMIVGTKPLDDTELCHILTPEQHDDMLTGRITMLQAKEQRRRNEQQQAPVPIPARQRQSDRI
ncbi:hypothetical protein, partial [Alterisphingorhabdus coralli]|uniref:hypothetical protein n=1 Tax=Alterisphingorhabdus coralli TaxID=3071408 RepID=UPI002936D69F